MRPFVAKSSGNVWNDRVRRLTARLVLKGCDFERALDWYAGGGHRFFERYAKEIAKAHRWCFIVGCNNSGTSLLQSALDTTGQISTLPFEGQLYTTVLCRSIRRKFPRVWSEYLDDLRLTANDSLAFVPRLLHDWMRDLPLPIRGVIVEKTPANAVRMGWLQEAFPRSCFIGLVRCGYAVAEGIRRTSNQRVERGARHWNLVNKVMVADIKNVDHFLEVRYEDLVNKPKVTARRLSEFIGIDPHAMKNAMGEKYAFRTVRGEGYQPVRNLNPDSIARLTEDELRRIHAEAAEMLEYFGYTPDIN